MLTSVRRVFAPVVLLSAVAVLPRAGQAQPPTMGLILDTPSAYVGYTLFESIQYTDTYLIDNAGLLVHSWSSAYSPGNMMYLLENGNLVRAGQFPGLGPFNDPGGGGVLQEFDWDGSLLWEFVYSDSMVRQHHDIEPLPNGNLLAIAWEFKSMAEAIAAGRNPVFLPDSALYPEHIIEVEPVGATGGNIVWEWHAWDHLVQDFDSTKANFGVVADHPELIDINFFNSTGADWLHANALDYDADLDQIVISINPFREFWIIDHSTSTAEAAGHTGGARGMGGDLLYRWGNPAAYDRGTFCDRQLHNQHEVHWIPEGLPGAGNILLFNNGNGRPEGNYSTIEEIVTTVDGNGDYPVPAPGVAHGPAAALWTFTATPPESLYGPFISGAQRQPNGNTLICEGPSGDIQEFDACDNLVWRYINPVNAGGPQNQYEPPTGNATFRANRYAPDYAGFDGRDLSPGAPIEIYKTTHVAVAVAPRAVLRQNAPNPFGRSTTIAFSLRDAAHVRLEIFDVAGRRVGSLVDRRLVAGEHVATWRAGSHPAGVYHYALRVDDEMDSKRMVVLR